MPGHDNVDTSATNKLSSAESDEKDSARTWRATLLYAFHMPPVTMVDMVVNYDLGNIKPAWQRPGLQVNASNLLNTTYVANCIGTTSCVYGQGRTVYATLSYHW